MHAHTRTATLFRVCQSMLRRAGSLNTPGRATRVKLTPESSLMMMTRVKQRATRVNLKPESSLMMMTTRACVRGKSAEQDEGAAKIVDGRR